MQNAFLKSFTDSFLGRRERVREVERYIEGIKRQNELMAQRRAQELADQQTARENQLTDMQTRREQELEDIAAANAREDTERTDREARADQNRVFEFLANASTGTQQLMAPGGVIPKSVADAFAPLLKSTVTQTTAAPSQPGRLGAVFPAPNIESVKPGPGYISKADEYKADQAENSAAKTLNAEEAKMYQAAVKLVESTNKLDMPMAQKQKDTKNAREFIWSVLVKHNPEYTGQPMPQNFMLSSGVSANTRAIVNAAAPVRAAGLAKQGIDPYAAGVISPPTGEVKPMPLIKLPGGDYKPAINPFSGLVQHSRTMQSLSESGKVAGIEGKNVRTARIEGGRSIGGGAKLPSANWMDHYGGYFDSRILKDERLQGIARSIATQITYDRNTGKREVPVMAQIAIQDLHRVAGITRQMFTPGPNVKTAVKKWDVTASALGVSNMSKMSIDGWIQTLKEIYPRMDEADLVSVARTSYALKHPGWARTQLDVKPVTKKPRKGTGY